MYLSAKRTAGSLKVWSKKSKAFIKENRFFLYITLLLLKNEYKRQKCR